MNKESKIYVAGHNGMLGSAIVRYLENKGFKNLILMSSKSLDLTNEQKVADFFELNKPEYVFIAAAKVGGIAANIERPVEFLQDNLYIQNNLLKYSHLHKVKKVCFVASSCIYPRMCEQPMKEEYLLTGPLEPTNEGYALAKISGIKLLQFYYKQYGLKGVSPIPCNLYGTNDSFDPKHAHVLSSMVKRFVDAVDNQNDEVTVWGDGSAMREFMHVDDAAKLIVELMDTFENGEIINVGTGTDVTIKELAETIANLAGFKGIINWDTTKPNGMPRKCLDISNIKSFNIEPTFTLVKGIEKTIEEYKIIKSNSI